MRRRGPAAPCPAGAPDDQAAPGAIPGPAGSDSTKRRRASLSARIPLHLMKLTSQSTRSALASSFSIWLTRLGVREEPVRSADAPSGRSGRGVRPSPTTPTARGRTSSSCRKGRDGSSLGSACQGERAEAPVMTPARPPDRSPSAASHAFIPSGVSRSAAVTCWKARARCAATRGASSSLGGAFSQRKWVPSTSPADAGAASSDGVRRRSCRPNHVGSGASGDESEGVMAPNVGRGYDGGPGREPDRA
jgi:hypothetical protein